MKNYKSILTSINIWLGHFEAKSNNHKYILHGLLGLIAFVLLISTPFAFFGLGYLALFMIIMPYNINIIFGILCSMVYLICISWIIGACGFTIE